MASNILDEIGRRIFGAYVCEFASDTSPDWPPVPQQRKDKWISIAQTALACAQEVRVPMILHCPACSERHVDKGRFEHHPHHTHACQSCGFVWRPALVPTVGVQFLPGFKDG